ncbi:Serine/threonine-protein kinase Nek11 [Sparganum proliferum]
MADQLKIIKQYMCEFRYEIVSVQQKRENCLCYLVKESNDKDKIILRTVRLQCIKHASPKHITSITDRLKTLSRLVHTHVLQPLDYFIENETFCTVYDFCDGGDLSTLISNMREAGSKIEKSLANKWIIQLLLGMNYMHEHSILHGSLDSRCILIKDKMVKIGTFEGAPQTVSLKDHLPNPPYYSSPEVLRQQKYTEKSDIWSLGVIMYEMCTTNRAFDGPNVIGLMWNILEGPSPLLTGDWPQQLQNLFDKILAKNPHDRPSAAQLLRVPFIKGQTEILLNRLESMVQNPKAVAEAISREMKRAETALIRQSASTERATDEVSPVVENQRQIADGAEGEEEEKIAELDKEPVDVALEFYLLPSLRRPEVKFFEEIRRITQPQPEPSIRQLEYALVKNFGHSSAFDEDIFEEDCLFSDEEEEVSDEQDKMPPEKSLPRHPTERVSSAERRAAKKEAIKAFLTRRIPEKEVLLEFNAEPSATERMEEAEVQYGVYEAKFGQLTFQDAADVSISFNEMPTSCMEKRLPEIENWCKQKRTTESGDRETEKEDEDDEDDDGDGGYNSVGTVEGQKRRPGHALSAAEKELVSLKLDLTRLQDTSLIDEAESVDQKSESAETAPTCEQSIAQLQRKCIDNLGVKKVEQARAYLRKRRIEEGGKAGEMAILSGLREICPDPKFGFLLEYLSFLEHVKATS